MNGDLYLYPLYWECLSFLFLLFCMSVIVSFVLFLVFFGQVFILIFFLIFLKIFRKVRRGKGVIQEVVLLKMVLTKVKLLASTLKNPLIMEGEPAM